MKLGRKIILCLIVVVVGSAMMLFMRNPLEGLWISKEGLQLEIEDDGEAKYMFPMNREMLEVDLSYSMNKEMRLLTLKGNPDSFQEAAEDSKCDVVAADIAVYLDGFLTTLEYSLDRDVLTLKEREYGETFIFRKVK